MHYLSHTVMIRSFKISLLLNCCVKVAAVFLLVDFTVLNVNHTKCGIRDSSSQRP